MQKYYCHGIKKLSPTGDNNCTSKSPFIKTGQNRVNLTWRWLLPQGEIATEDAAMEDREADEANTKETGTEDKEENVKEEIGKDGTGNEEGLADEQGERGDEEGTEQKHQSDMD